MVKTGGLHAQVLPAPVPPQRAERRQEVNHVRLELAEVELVHLTSAAEGNRNQVSTQIWPFFSINGTRKVNGTLLETKTNT